MVVTKKILLRELRDLFFFFVISLLQGFLMCRQCTPQRFFILTAFTFFMWLLLWKGNAFLSGILSRKISWTEFPLKSFLIGISVTIIYTVLMVLSLMKAFEYITNMSFGKASMNVIYGAIIVTILISLFLHGREFLMFWRKASLEKEMFEKESIAARYEALKNQVSPHFLFNSLSALTNLVYEDPDKAVRFIKQLSEVYRYVLETREKEVVSILDELKFLDSYLYLQGIRFGKKLKVTIGTIPEGIQIPPMALQMLIENAIKHNVVSEEDPLSISVYSENGFLVVENNLQKKTSVDDVDGSPGLGLTNIRKRYEFLSNEKVQIAEDQKKFTVKLPALKS
jgi:sensor histidine kinase YesM